tara:strand:- start:294 stop:479 length:186 start_codon:yes stop_codon:yes gene_type:complete
VITTKKEIDNSVAIEVSKIARIVKELEDGVEQGTLTAGNSRVNLIKIENLIKRINRELPQF